MSRIFTARRSKNHRKSALPGDPGSVLSVFRKKAGHILICLLFSSWIPHFTAAQKAVSLTHSSQQSFIENKGQIIDQKNKPNPDVLFLMNTPGMNVQLRKGGFSYDLYAPKSPEGDFFSPFRGSGGKQEPWREVKFHRIDFDLVGCNPNGRITTSESSSDYLNYYTAGTPVEGVTFVRSFQSVTYKDIYPNVDLEFVMDEEVGFKYNFVIYPGGAVENILLRISGAEFEVTKDGSLLLRTSQGIIEERIPTSFFQQVDIQSPVNVKFHRIRNNIYGLSVQENIPVNSILFIDPIPHRIWSTFYGGWMNDAICDGVLDQEGNLIFSGVTWSDNNIATAGSHQSTRTQSDDCMLLKFTADGQRIWGTYYGGNGQDTQSYCDVDNTNNIYLAGDTYSSTNIATPGAFKTNYQGGEYAFLAKFNSQGIRLWGTYFGGNWNNTFGLDCKSDNSGNVYMCGTTNSNDSIATTGSHQTVKGGLDDGFLVKFDSSGARLWATYYGGSSFEYAYSCITDSNVRVYIGGFTFSSNNISSIGSHQQSFGGGFNDGFLAAFDSSGQRLWGTYYGGSEGDGIYGLTLSADQYIYCAGVSESQNNISTSGTFQPSLNGDEDAFLVKFDTTGTRKWGTYFGGIDQDQGESCAVDDSGYVFLAGKTLSTDFIATPNAFQTEYKGNKDVFLVKIDTTGQSRLWGTYFGDTAVEEWGHVFVDSFDNQYLTGWTSSTNNISTPGSHQPIFGGNSDGFIAKFSDCTLPDIAHPISGPDTICENSTNILYSTQPILNAVTYSWIIPSGVTITSGQTTETITVDFGPGASSDYISVKGVNPCGEGDSAFLYVVVNPIPTPTISGCDSVCEGLSCTYYTESGRSQYQWDLSTGGTVIAGGSQTDTLVTIQWNSVGNQWLSVNYTDTNGCEAMTPTIFNVEVTVGDSIYIDVSSSKDSICFGSSVTFSAQTLNTGVNPLFQWFINGVDTNHNDSTLTNIPSQTDTVFCIVTSFETCRSNNPDTSNTQIIHVFPILPITVNISASENPVCIDDTVIFTVVAMNGGLNPGYQWYLDGNPVGTNDSSYSYMPSNGDQISCILTSSEQCTSNNPATSNIISMEVNPLLPVGISISASENPVCAGLPVTYTATPAIPVVPQYVGIAPWVLQKDRGRSGECSMYPVGGNKKDRGSPLGRLAVRPLCRAERSVLLVYCHPNWESVQ